MSVTAWKHYLMLAYCGVSQEPRCGGELVPVGRELLPLRRRGRLRLVAVQIFRCPACEEVVFAREDSGGCGGAWYARTYPRPLKLKSPRPYRREGAGSVPSRECSFPKRRRPR